MSDASAQPIRRALLSVSDKRGLVELAEALATNGAELLSTGGTARALAQAGLAVTEVAEYTGFPEIMGGRVKTLHPRIHGGILGRRDIDADAMAAHDIGPIDLVVVNLYPFVETVAQPEIGRADAIEHIDVGGPAMVRAAAKNHQDVAVVTDPDDYAELAAEIRAGGVTETTRRRLAAKAFGHTAQYDAAIADWLAAQERTQESEAASEALPASLGPKFEPVLDLRYGENPHQRARFFAESDGPAATVARARLLQGKSLSFNNIADADTALETVKLFDEPACVIVKHANPCGAAVGADAAEAYVKAYATDPTSAFGGIIAFNRPVDARLAAAILDQQFVEVVIAPEFAPDCSAALAARPNTRVLETGPFDGPTGGLDYRGVAGGMLVQERDTALLGSDGLQPATSAHPEATTERDLLFAWRVAKAVKSNAIVYAADGQTVGIGAGQMSRVDSARIAGVKAADAGLATEGAVMASDAFIPFRDVVDVAAAAGIRAIIQPGGSKRDHEVIAACEEHGITMLFTGMRHFRH
ncbi:MAG: bifunctional phosphoribosylaminoimidazolecarboxamide formyltransferase/IMP cyclohydrolase [Halofilum sp. (in: g-proteobacteria)]